METSSISISSYNLHPLLKDEVYSVIQQMRQRQSAKVATKRWQTFLLAAMMMWVAGISMYDMYWSFKTQNVLIDHEQNPIGKLLINADNGDIALFMTFKALGNVIVLVTIPLLFLYKRWWGLLTATALSIGQLLLFAYLSWGHLLGN